MFDNLTCDRISELCIEWLTFQQTMAVFNVLLFLSVLMRYIVNAQFQCIADLLRWIVKPQERKYLLR